MKNFIPFLLLFILSCNLSENTANPPSDNIDSLFNTMFVKDSTLIESRDAAMDTKDSVILDFQSFKICIRDYLPDTIYFSKNKDTAYITESIGESIEDKMLTIQDIDIAEVSIEQGYINSIFISNEGPLCVIENWKCYKSPLIKLKYNQEKSFKTISYGYDSFNEFPSVTAKEIREVVKNQCDEKYYDLVHKVNSVNDSPIGVYKSNYILKIKPLAGSPKYIYVTSIPGC